MCGIFGYVGKKNAVKIALTGLERLEYRGYDSAGIGGVKDGKICVVKEVGKVSRLKEIIAEGSMTLDFAIAHTRWATHGVPSKINAHPHTDEKKTLALVHNGIIENHEMLRKELKKEGVQFVSDTDSEVVAHLVAKYYKGDLLKAVQKTVARLKGSYAIALVHGAHPGQIVAVAHESPLAVGMGRDEAFVASDPTAFADSTRDVLFLTDSEIAVVSKEKLEIYNIHNDKIEKELQRLDVNFEEITKGEHEHYTLKEIYEQPQSIKNGMLSRFVEEWSTASFEEIHAMQGTLHQATRVLIIGCGTSWHAGLIGALMLEELAELPTHVEISSEFRYKNPIISPGTVAIAISQSGETADTMAAVRELKAKGVPVLGICNVQGSALVREADGCVFLRAGPEVGVCSTKAFTNTLLVFALLAVLLGRQRFLSKEKGREILGVIKKLATQTEEVLKLAPSIEKIAKKYARYENFFFLGRQYMFPTALEGALKLKEISYINANGYPAGEMKHGPIALIGPECPTFAFCAHEKTFDKMESNLREVKARSGKIIALCFEGMDIGGVADDVIFIPKTLDFLAPLLASVAGQLFAYYVARERGSEIDQPKNLAKSVTVE